MNNDEQFWAAIGSLCLRSTVAAGIACAPWRGKHDKIAADDAAVKAISGVIQSSGYSAYIAIGEGELDNAPMLSMGDRLGPPSGRVIDIAVDPLEGTTLCSLNLPGSLSTIAIAKGGSIITAPDSYMRKIMAGSACPAELVKIGIPTRTLVHEYARATKKSPMDVVVCVLDKPRHAELIESIKSSGASVALIRDGDVPAAVWVCDPEKYGIDLYLGVGGGPEGVLSAAALKGLGGQIAAKFEPQNEAQRAAIKHHDRALLERTLTLDDLIMGDCVFSMTSITGSKGLEEIKVCDGKYYLQSRIISSYSATNRFVESSSFY
jgi:fructose-1,6-bisphosphatase II / sedoheptulose-1,7-bisphosphatase